MQQKKRESKRLPKYVMDELNEINNSKVATEFISLKKLPFSLTKKQKELLKLIEESKIMTITGPPGTSKTFITCYAAIQALLDKKCDKIILSKPTEVLSGTSELGYLPGSLNDKIAPYVESFFDAFDDILLSKDFKHLWDEKTIEFKPAQFLRGRTLKNAFIIIDEAQNFDIKALKSIVTRYGKDSTLIFMGDTKQNDIKSKNVALDIFVQILDPIDGFNKFDFLREDIVREKILIEIVDRFEQFEEKGLMPQTIRNS
jgi:phosphate starvation-inducible protein PhoH and related proteins